MEYIPDDSLLWIFLDGVRRRRRHKAAGVDKLHQMIFLTEYSYLHGSEYKKSK